MSVGAAYVMCARSGGLLGRGRADAPRVRPAHHGHHRARDRQRGRTGVHHREPGTAGAARRDASGLVGAVRTSLALWSEKVQGPRRRHLVNVAVVGAAGYAGGELLRLLYQHPEVREVVATSQVAAARRSPRLIPRSTITARVSRRGARRDPRGAAMPSFSRARGVVAVAGEVFAARPGLVVDLAADFQVRSQALYERYYGEHTAPDLLPRFCYGLADVVEKACAARAPSPHRAASPPQRSSRSTAGPRAGGRGPFAVRRHRLQPRRRQPDPHTIRCGPTTCSPTRCWGTGTRRKSCSRGASGWADRRHRPTHDPLGSVRPRHLSHPARQTPEDRAIDGATGASWFREAYAGRPFVRLLDAPPELTHAVGTNYA